MKARKSTTRIEVCPKRVINCSRDKFQGDLRTYMIDKNGNYHLLNFSNNVAHTIYIMNLIYLKRHGNKQQPLDIKEAFIKTYDLIYMGNAEEEYNKLMCRISAIEVDYEGRAKSRCFNSIANCLYDICNEINVDASPYIVDDKMPITINPDLVTMDIQQQFLNQIAFR